MNPLVLFEIYAWKNKPLSPAVPAGISSKQHLFPATRKNVPAGPPQGVHRGVRRLLTNGPAREFCQSRKKHLGCSEMLADPPGTGPNPGLNDKRLETEKNAPKLPTMRNHLPWPAFSKPFPPHPKTNKSVTIQMPEGEITSLMEGGREGVRSWKKNWLAGWTWGRGGSPTSY